MHKASLSVKARAWWNPSGIDACWLSESRMVRQWHVFTSVGCSSLMTCLVSAQAQCNHSFSGSRAYHCHTFYKQPGGALQGHSNQALGATAGAAAVGSAARLDCPSSMRCVQQTHLSVSYDSACNGCNSQYTSTADDTSTMPVYQTSGSSRPRGEQQLYQTTRKFLNIMLAPAKQTQPPATE